LEAQLLVQIGASGCRQLRNNTSLLARPAQGKLDQQLWRLTAVLLGVNGYQFQLSSTQLTALAAAREVEPKEHPIALCPKLLALLFAAGFPQHPGNT
jgi:hypothetical protein